MTHLALKYSVDHHMTFLEHQSIYTIDIKKFKELKEMSVCLKSE